MGDDDCSKSLREETVGETPDEACDRCRHDQHEVHLGDVNEAVDQGRYYESYIRIPS